MQQANKPGDIKANFPKLNSKPKKFFKKKKALMPTSKDFDE